jgi:hypothetical protein
MARDPLLRILQWRFSRPQSGSPGIAAAISNLGAIKQQSRSCTTRTRWRLLERGDFAPANERKPLILKPFN